MLSIYKHSCSITSLLVKSANFDIPEHHFYVDGDKTFFPRDSMASNEK